MAYKTRAPRLATGAARNIVQAATPNVVLRDSVEVQPASSLGILVLIEDLHDLLVDAGVVTELELRHRLFRLWFDVPSELAATKATIAKPLRRRLHRDQAANRGSVH